MTEDGRRWTEDLENPLEAAPPKKSCTSGYLVLFDNVIPAKARIQSEFSGLLHSKINMPINPDVSNISMSAGALVKEFILAKCYKNFTALLNSQALSLGSEDKAAPLAIIPIRIYRSWTSTMKTYVLAYSDEVYLDLKPSFKNQDRARIAAFNRTTMRKLAVIPPTFWDKFNIFNCGDHISLTFLQQNNTELALRLLAEVSGENTLTQDKEKTKWLFEHLKTLFGMTA